jgi:hypothetical protein
MMRGAWGIPVLRMLDDQGKVIKINSQIPIEVETSYFKGIILTMIRCEGEFESFNTYREYFQNKDRKFEIQFQVSDVIIFGALLSYLTSFIQTIGHGQIQSQRYYHAWGGIRQSATIGVLDFSINVDFGYLQLRASLTTQDWAWR